ncbi:hypothetical protein F4776DRAFT_489186 [Hypoxylon sp. NC0597]|nr:hypothetical protein F4776DRAFT_489186 [Hypoxylon sp. NC0597]
MSRGNNAFSGEAGPSGSQYQSLDWVNKAISDWKAKGGLSTETNQTSSNGSFPRVIFDGVNVVDLTKTVNKIPSWFERASASWSTSRTSSGSPNQTGLSRSNQYSSNTSVVRPFERSINGIDSNWNNNQSSSSEGVSQPISNRGINQADSTGSSRIPLRLQGVDKIVNTPVDRTSSNGDNQANSNGNSNQASLWLANSNRSIEETAPSSTNQTYSGGSNNQAFSRLTSGPVVSGNVIQPFLGSIFNEILSGRVNVISSRRRYNCFPRLIRGSEFSGNIDGGRSSSSNSVESSGSSNQLPTAWINATFITGNTRRPSPPILNDGPFNSIPPSLRPPERNHKCAAPFPLSPHGCGLVCACDMVWLVSDRSKQQPPPEKPYVSHYRNDSYEYRLCEDPVRSPQDLPRDCQIVQPLSLQRDMYPYITHPNSNPPVAVIPRASERDLQCPFCKTLPELRNVRYMCAFHMYYFAGVRNQDDFNVVKNLRANPIVKGFESTSVEAMAKTIQKCRDLLVGSTPEPGTDYLTGVRTPPPRAIGQELEEAGRAAHSFTSPGGDDDKYDDHDDDVFSSPISVNYNNGFMLRLLRLRVP